MSVNDVGAVVLAAGASRRMGGPTNKVFLPISGRPVIARTLDIFGSNPEVVRIVLVAAPSELVECEEEIVAPCGFKSSVRLVQGGPTRHQSEYLGLQALESEIRSGTVRTVLVHDGVRPFVTRQLLDRLISEARRVGAAIPGLPVGPGVAVATADGQLSGWLTDIWAVQTPQAFDGQLVLDAHRHAATIGFEGTDTSEVVEQSGHRVAVVEGSPLNIKITTSDDLVLADEIAGRFPWSDEAELSAVRLSHL